MTRGQRLLAATLITGALIGVGAPAASAATAAPHAATAAVRTVDRAPAAVSHTAPASQSAPASAAAAADVKAGVQARGISSAAKKLAEKIAKSKYGKKAIAAAKKGRNSFKSWVNGLSNFNPLKWAIKAAPAYILDEVISYLVNHF
ncbi:hypothetical protein [Streptomyces sp. NPDC048248]|uniref:hypothetical protein n=1 Tax=Streptomyces sp. NPDC048248 TaxID=3365523 RepID=UPI00371C3DC8